MFSSITLQNKIFSLNKQIFFSTHPFQRLEDSYIRIPINNLKEEIEL